MTSGQGSMAHNTSSAVDHRRLVYDLSPRGQVDFPPEKFTEETGVSWLNDHAPASLGLVQPPEVIGTKDPTERAFLLYYLYKYGANSKDTESHLLAPIGWPAKNAALPCGHVILQYTDRALARLVKKEDLPSEAAAAGGNVSELIGTLKEKFSLTDIQAVGSARWSDVELRKLSGALDLVPARHRVVLQGMTIVRVEVSSGNPQEAGHLFWNADGKYTMELGDATFSRDKLRVENDDKIFPASFVGGTSDTVAPQSYQTIIHEIGHGVECFDYRKDAVDRRRAVADLEKKYQTAYDESQRAYETWESDSSGNKGQLAAVANSAGEAADAAGEKWKALEGEYNKFVSSSSSQCLASFGEMIKKSRQFPITEYARSNNQEFFAEAYAAWVLDKEYLGLHAPDIVDWFDALRFKNQD